MLFVLVAILGLALLMVVHESGHHFAARAFGMRVIRFSIGFGPAIWKHQPKGSDTVYQVALIPFLAYVQIAGMNPLEEVDPNDKGSYANASLIGRIVTIFAGSFANYLFASVLFFAAFVIAGDQVPTKRLEILPDTPAAAAKLLDGDEVLRIDGKPVGDFEAMRAVIMANPEKPLAFTVLREGAETTIQVTPRKNAKLGHGEIGVQPKLELQAVPLADAAKRSIVRPALFVVTVLDGLWRIVTGQEKAELSGPPGIVKMTKRAAEEGISPFLTFLGSLSTYLAVFNLLPVPALDGGRLCFLIYEAVWGRRPNAKVEAYVHAIGFALLLSLLVVVSVMDVGKLIR